MSEIKVVLVSNQIQHNQCLEIRRKIFIEEQGVPETLEIDDFEGTSKHFLALLDGHPVGTGRLRLKNSYVKFERIASLKDYRGYGIGKAIMEQMQRYAAQEFPTYLPVMHAQKNAVGFYLKLGWVPIGQNFFEANILHQVLIYPPKDRDLVKNLEIWKFQESREDIKNYLNSI
jgi:predicted GNAT family N-acyltransferase